jgi:hypothetical protein
VGLPKARPQGRGLRTTLTKHRVGRNYLTHSAGDAINAVLAAVGYNFRLMLRWLEFILLKDCSRRRRSAQKPLHAPDGQVKDLCLAMARALHGGRF